jgi:hypothetical protein
VGELFVGNDVVGAHSSSATFVGVAALQYTAWLRTGRVASCINGTGAQTRGACGAWLTRADLSRGPAARGLCLRAGRPSTMLPKPPEPDAQLG